MLKGSWVIYRYLRDLKRKNSMENTKRFDELIRGCVVILFTIAIYAQSPVYVRTMLGAIVTLPLYF